MRDPLEWPTRDLLSHRAATTPDATAVIDADAGESRTYAEFDARVDDVAARLASVGADTGPRPDDSLGVHDRLGVLMDTRVSFAAVYFAAMRRGITVVSLNVRETATELESKVRRTEIDALVCEAGTEELALEVADRDRPVVSVDDPERDGVDALRARSSSDSNSDSGSGSDSSSGLDASPNANADSTGDDVSETNGDVEPVPLERDRTHLLMFTSGTSGEPKIVRLTVGNLVSSATASAFRLGVTRDDRWLCCLPMYHMGGLAPVVRSTLYGTPVVIQREFDPEATARVIDEYDVTGVSLVPTMCKRLLDAGWSPPDSLRFVLLGGAPATSELLERCREAGVPVYPTYGMTETASQIATATPEETARHEGTVGRPLVCTDVTVVDESGEPVPAGESGELVVSGPTVTPGYLSDAETTAAFGEHGLHTGDIGYRDEGGRLWVLNRRSDRIVTGGENVDPGEVLEVLRAHPAVEEAAVVGLEDPEWGERVAALVVPADGDGAEAGETDAIDLESLLAHCDGRLAGFKRPKTIGFADELPRTASGTVDREAVRKRLLEDGIDATEST